MKLALLFTLVLLGLACGDAQIGDRRSIQDDGSLADDDGSSADDDGFPVDPIDQDDSVTKGGWPSSSDPLGHRHPECEALYGMTPAQIEATPCNLSGGSLSADASYSACSIRAALFFAGSNTTLDCVYIDTGDGSPAGTFCDGPSGNCSNLTMRRTTFKGSLGPGSTGYTQLMISLTSSRGFANASLLIEQSDIMESQVLVMCGSAIDGASNPYPGEGDKGLIIRDSRFGRTVEYNDAHTDYVYLAEGCKGVLLERNLLDGRSALSNVGSIVQAQGSSTDFGNHLFRSNRFVHDGSGHMFNFDRASGSSADACAAPVIFESNVFDWEFDLSDGLADSLFSYSTTGRECPRIESRGSSSICSNNTFADGSAVSCSSDGT